LVLPLNQFQFSAFQRFKTSIIKEIKDPEIKINKNPREINSDSGLSDKEVK